MDYEELNNAYNDLIQPNKLIQRYKTPEQFVNYLGYCDLLDLYDMLRAFEEVEEYSYCAMIRDVIRYKES